MIAWWWLHPVIRASSEGGTSEFSTPVALAE